MNRPLAIAFLGVAHYHADFWAQAFAQTPGVTVTGFFEEEAAARDAFAVRHGIAPSQDPDALAAAADAVAICGITAEHRPMVEVAARHRRPVLCEKPLAATWNDVVAICDTVARSGIPFMQSFPKRFDPINGEVRAIVAGGRLGRLTLARVRHGHMHGLSETFADAWFVDKARSGGGTLLDEGVHAADFLRSTFGEPESVSAVVSHATLGLPVEDTAAATFLYPCGLIAEVATGWCFAGADTSIEIYGTEGSLLLGGVDLASRETRDKDFLRVLVRNDGGGWTSSPTVPYFRTGVFHEHVAFAFVEALRKGGPMPVTLEDGLRAFAMIEAAYRAAESGRRIGIAYDGPSERD